MSAPKGLTEGLVRVPAPALPTETRVVCLFCRCTVPTDHSPNGEECRMLVDERRFKRHGDW